MHGEVYVVVMHSYAIHCSPFANLDQTPAKRPSNKKGPIRHSLRDAKRMNENHEGDSLISVDILYRRGGLDSDFTLTPVIL